MPSLDDPIFILGAGAWGLSTALHLHNQGYTNITLFERAEEIPSRYSAAYDLNKIVRAEYEDPFYTELALDAINGWKTPLFGPYYHETGYIVAATGKAPKKAIEYLHNSRQSVAKHPVFAPGIKSLDKDEDFRKLCWQYSGPLTGWTGYFNRLAGYAHSSDAMRGVWAHLAIKGIKFVLGESHGKVTELLYSTSGDKRRCTGIRTADGLTHNASTVIVALGPYAATLLPTIGHSVVARCWSVAHVQLTKAECDYLRFIPTLNVRDLGFFFEPDPETRLFKLCPLGAGFTNKKTKIASGATISLPPGEQVPPPQDFIPKEDELKLRALLRETFPWMADRPFVDNKLCWFADTKDSEYCIDFVPDTDKSVIVLSGDSGHGFKMMPVFGKWVVNLLQKGEQPEKRWQWRQTDGKTEQWGDEVSWRIGQARELDELIAEKEKLIRARL